LEQRITTLSLTHQILSPYTAFVGVETTSSKKNNTQMKVRHVPIQISKGDEPLSIPQPSYIFAHHAPMGPVPMMSMPRQGSLYGPSTSQFRIGA
jgi:hypothetical protein